LAASTTPINTGEDIFGLEEGFQPLLDNRAVNSIHPDIETSGGLLETKKIADYALGAVILSEAKNLGSCSFTELRRSFVAPPESHVIPAQAGIHWTDNGSPLTRGRRR
jgi:hypothetical protein